MLQAPAFSSKRGQRHAECRRRRLDTDLFNFVLSGLQFAHTMRHRLVRALATFLPTIPSTAFCRPTTGTWTSIVISQDAVNNPHADRLLQQPLGACLTRSNYVLLENPFRRALLALPPAWLPITNLRIIHQKQSQLPDLIFYLVFPSDLTRIRVPVIKIPVQI